MVRKVELYKELGYLAFIEREIQLFLNEEFQMFQFSYSLL